ncbi:MAG: hypothetical protein HY098_03935 [Nitrospinae bacterium]|nr:hypothetical protein [Nitrospinota bacterium]
MYGAVLRYEKVSDASEARLNVNESFIPLLGRTPGFVAYDWIDAGGGVMISSGVLRDKAGTGGQNKKAAEWMGRLRPRPQGRQTSRPVKESQINRRRTLFP